MDDMDIEELGMYTNVFDDGRVLYGFGRPWVAMAMYTDDYGYATEEEAVRAWYRQEKPELDCDPMDWYRKHFKGGDRDAFS